MNELPNNNNIEIKGTVVTFSYESFSQNGVPANPRMSRVREDISWKQILLDFSSHGTSFFSILILLFYHFSFSFFLVLNILLFRSPLCTFFVCFLKFYLFRVHASPGDRWDERQRKKESRVKRVDDWCGKRNEY